MQKYNIEGGIDFFNELYKSLDIVENEEKTDEDNNLCLITNTPLIDYFVKMECGHKFNYIPLYNDIKNHKYKFNNMEGNTSRLNTDEIRCPYCRHKQKGVLPYHEELGLNQINGVNTINASKIYQNNYNYNYNKCEFLKTNPNFDPSGNNPVETSTYASDNCKYFACAHYGYKTIAFSNLHAYYISNNLTTDKHYCYMHMKSIIQTHKKELVNKAKEEAKQLKIKEREEAKQLKEESKKLKEQVKQLKDEAKKLKEELKKSVVNAKLNIKPTVDDVENTIVGTINLDTSCVCCVILKSGLKKGQPCGCKIVENNLCKRHLKKEK